MSTIGETIMYARIGRRTKLPILDLNNAPPNEEEEQVEGPVISLSYNPSGHQPGIPMPQVQHGHIPAPLLSPPVRRDVQPLGSAPVQIDVEDLDDDVIISSPRSFEQARNNSRRILRRTPVVDVESVAEETSARIGNQRYNRRRINSQPPVIDCELYVDLEMETMSSYVERVEPVAPSQPLSPKQLTFSCPVCMGPLTEEVATKCGHIFCKECIQLAIHADPKCPTCRRQINKRGLVRIYLPAAN